jgi:hypothetical protein
MTFATEKDKSSSSRFMLIRLTGRIKYVGTSYDATTYRVLVHKKPIKVTRYRLSTGGDGGTFVVLAEVSTIGAMTTGKWFYDTSDGYLYFNTPAGYSYYAMVDFEEFVTGGIERYYPRIPTGAGDNETWKPLVSTYPKFTHSIEDISAGVFSISGSSFDVINASNWADKYLVGYGSFYERDCDVWIGINSELKKVFTGTVSSVAQEGKTLAFNVLDKFNLMNKTATFAALPEYLTANASCSPSFSTAVSADDQGKPIPRHLQGYLVYKYQAFNTDIVSSADFYNGICVDYSKVISGTVNRKWICGSVKWRHDSLVGDVAKQYFGANVTAVFDTGAGESYVSFGLGSSNLVAGQRVKWTGSKYGTILKVGATEPVPPYAVYDILIRHDTLAPAVGNTFTQLYAFIGQFGEGTNTALLTETVDYNIAVDSTTGHVQVTFVNSFETAYTGSFAGTYIDPDADKFSYTFLCSETNLTHGIVMKALVEASGLTANATSFTAADSSLSAKVRFSIPYFGDSIIGTYADYAAKILESAGGYLRLNESDEVEYKLFAAPAPTETLTTSDYADLSVDVGYQDIYTTIETINDHKFNNRLTDIQVDYGSARQLVQTNEEAYALFGSRRIKYMQNVFFSMSNSIARVLALVSNRRMRFRFKTATENIDTSIGDDYYIQSDNVNNGTAVSVKVVSKSVSVTGTEVEAIDLYGV